MRIPAPGDVDVPLPPGELPSPACAWCDAPMFSRVLGASPLANCPAHDEDALSLADAREQLAKGRKGSASADHKKQVIALYLTDLTRPQLSPLGPGTVRHGPDGTRYEFTAEGWIFGEPTGLRGPTDDGDTP